MTFKMRLRFIRQRIRVSPSGLLPHVIDSPGGSLILENQHSEAQVDHDIEDGVSGYSTWSKT